MPSSKSLLLPETKQFSRLPFPRDVKRADDIKQYLSLALMVKTSRKKVVDGFTVMRNEFKLYAVDLEALDFVAAADQRDLRNVLNRLRVLHEDVDNILWSIQNLARSDDISLVDTVIRKVLAFVELFQDSDIEASYNSLIKRYGERMVQRKNLHHNPSRKNLKQLGEEIDAEQKSELKRLKSEFLSKKASGKLVVSRMPIWAYLYGNVDAKALHRKGFETYTLYHDGLATIKFVHANHIVMVFDDKRFGSPKEQLAYVNDLSGNSYVFVTDEPSSDEHKAYWIMERSMAKRFQSSVRNVGQWVLMFLG